MQRLTRLELNPSKEAHDDNVEEYIRPLYLSGRQSGLPEFLVTIFSGLIFSDALSSAFVVGVF
jgi:hypothetical protein